MPKKRGTTIAAVMRLLKSQIESNPEAKTSSVRDNDLGNVNIACADTRPVMNFKDCDLYYESLDSYRSINLLELEPMIYGYTGLEDPMNILETNVNATSTTAQLKHSPEAIRDKMIWLPMSSIPSRKLLNVIPNWPRTIYDCLFEDTSSRENLLSTFHVLRKNMLQTRSLQKLRSLVVQPVQPQIFVGTKSYYTNVFGMKRESEAPRTLDDFVRKTGAP